jgi:hypothetical protein
LLSEKVIPPEGEGEIKVTYSSGKRKGKQSKSIQVLSDDPVQPQVSLKVQGTVKEAVVCTPNRLNFGNVLQGETVTKQVVVAPGEGEKAKVKAVEVTSEYLTADFSKSKEKDGYLVDVTVSPEAPRGRINGQLKIETDNEHAKTVTITVMATITGEIVATPDRLSLVLQKGEPNTGSVLSLEKVKGENLQITKIESNPEYITAELQTVEAGKRYKVNVNGTEQAPIGRDNGSVTIFTNDPEDPKINIPLTVTVRGNLNIVPEQLSFGLVNQGRSSSKTISVSTRKEDLKIKKVEIESELDFLKAEVDNNATGQRSVIRVTVEKDAIVGPITGKVIIHTDDPLQPKVEVPLSGRVRTEPST